LTVAGLDIPGGMIYVGSGLGSVGHSGSVEPALIDPRLPVNLRNPDLACEKMPYWPSYSAIPPESRAAYLQWLAGGRKDPGVGVGHVFLFLYGLERRALFDAASDPVAREEIPSIVEEVDRLLGIYGSQGSFRGYASSFVEVLRGVGADKLVDAAPPATAYCPGYEFPLSIRMALGLMSIQRKPVSADWALAWYMSAPTTRLRTPASRCADEFRALFRNRYQQKFGEGLVVAPPNKTIDLSYRPASASFAGTLRLKFSDRRLASGVPDVTSLAGPLNKISEVAESCAVDLEPFSRWVGRNPALRSSPAAVALLPAELVGRQVSTALSDFWDNIEGRFEGEDLAEVPGSELLRYWRKPSDSKLVRTDYVLLAQLLEKRGYGVEPDVRFGGPVLAPDKPCILFHLAPGSPSAPSTAYAAAATTLQLAVAVASADEQIDPREVEALEGHLERALPVTEMEKGRLRANLRWLITERPPVTGLKKRLEGMERGQREAIGRFLVGVATADGIVTSAEVKILEKLYRLLDLETTGMYSELHAQAVTPAEPPSEPVVVRPPGPGSPGFSIPLPPDASGTPAVLLNMKRVEEKLNQTAAVSALLQSIFVEEEGHGAAAGAPADSAERMVGLDAPHSAFLRALMSKESWSRTEVEKIAAESGVLPDGALDAVNEASITACGDPLWEGDDAITIDQAVRKELAL
jgi:uncharacterized tellurite resistance protein B-like protein